MLKKKERVHFVVEGCPTLEVYGKEFNWEHDPEKGEVCFHVNLSDNLKPSTFSHDRQDFKDILERYDRIKEIQLNAKGAVYELNAGLRKSQELKLPFRIVLNFGKVRHGYHIVGGKGSEEHVYAKVEYAG